MSYQSKLWLQYPPNTSTPQTAAALIAMETRAANYVGSVGVGVGVGSYADYLPIVAGGLSVTVAAGACVIALDTNGGTEHYESAAAQTVTLATADVTNPRIDQVILVAPGSAASAGDSQAPSVQVLTGTPTVGATLANRTGAAVLPARAIRICDCLVTAGLVTLPQANVFDRRQQPYFGTVPMPANPSALPLIDQVPLQGHPDLIYLQQQLVPAHTNFQIAVPVFLPRRVVNAGHVRWGYGQFSSALTGSWNWGLMDAGGTLLAATGVQSFVGGGGVVTINSAPVSLGTVEAGWYIQIMGFASLATGSLFYNGWTTATNLNGQPPAGQGLIYARSTGGTSIPTNLLTGAVQDLYNAGVVASPPMPACLLSA